MDQRDSACSFYHLFIFPLFLSIHSLPRPQRNYLAPDKRAPYKLDFTRRANASSVAFTTSGVDYSEHDLGEMLPHSETREHGLPSITIDFLLVQSYNSWTRESAHCAPLHRIIASLQWPLKCAYRLDGCDNHNRYIRCVINGKLVRSWLIAHYALTLTKCVNIT